MWFRKNKGKPGEIIIIRKEDWDHCIFVIFVIAFRFHQSCLDVWILVRFSCLMHGWLRYVLSSRSLLLSLFLIIQSIWSPRGKNIELSLPQMDCCDFFWLFPKYLSSPQAIWALLIWTLKEQWVFWPPLLTGKQRAWPKIQLLLSWIPSNPQTNVGRTRPSKSNLFSVRSGDSYQGFSSHISWSTNTQCGSGTDHSYTDDTFN